MTDREGGAVVYRGYIWSYRGPTGMIEAEPETILRVTVESVPLTVERMPVDAAPR